MLEWKRIKDGYHNGKPIYEYEAIKDDVKYHIYNAIDAGFGISIFNTKTKKYVNDRHGIVWCRTLKRCKEYAAKYA